MSGTINAIVGVVVGLIVIAFMLGIGMFLYYTSYTSISSLNLGATGNTTLATLNTNVWSAYSVLAPLPIILGAGAVISALLAAFLWLRR
jgi:hypothetical protein